MDGVSSKVKNEYNMYLNKSYQSTKEIFKRVKEQEAKRKELLHRLIHVKDDNIKLTITNQLQEVEFERQLYKNEIKKIKMIKKVVKYNRNKKNVKEMLKIIKYHEKRIDENDKYSPRFDENLNRIHNQYDDINRLRKVNRSKRLRFIYTRKDRHIDELFEQIENSKNN